MRLKLHLPFPASPLLPLLSPRLPSPSPRLHGATIFTFGSTFTPPPPVALGAYMLVVPVRPLKSVAHPPLIVAHPPLIVTVPVLLHVGPPLVGPQRRFDRIPIRRCIQCSLDCLVTGRLASLTEASRQL